jgi:hypothetical protein
MSGAAGEVLSLHASEEWDCWVACYTLKDLLKVARGSGWIKDLMSGAAGEVLSLHASEEEHAEILFLVMWNSPNSRTSK